LPINGPVKIIWYAVLATIPWLFACRIATRVPLSGEVSLADVPNDFNRQAIDKAGTPLGIRPPPIRVRLDYQFNRRPLGPGGEAYYGEVEDHDISLNDLAYFMDNPNDEGVTGLSAAMVGYSRALAGRRLLVVKYSRHDKTRTLTSFAVAPWPDLLSVLATARAEVRGEPGETQR
jgi:hypothetical protein